MDRDEYDFIKSDYNTYNDPPELDRCAYCEEENDLNKVIYAINDDYDMIVIAINPMPHDKILIPEGYKKKSEFVCNEHLKEEYGA